MLPVARERPRRRRQINNARQQRPIPPSRQPAEASVGSKGRVFSFSTAGRRTRPYHHGTAISSRAQEPQIQTHACRPRIHKELHVTACRKRNKCRTIIARQPPRHPPHAEPCVKKIPAPHNTQFEYETKKKATFLAEGGRMVAEGHARQAGVGAARLPPRYETRDGGTRRLLLQQAGRRRTDATSARRHAVEGVTTVVAT